MNWARSTGTYVYWPIHITPDAVGKHYTVEEAGPQKVVIRLGKGRRRITQRDNRYAIAYIHLPQGYYEVIYNREEGTIAFTPVEIDDKVKLVDESKYRKEVERRKECETRVEELSAAVHHLMQEAETLRNFALQAKEKLEQYDQLLKRVEELEKRAQELSQLAESYKLQLESCERVRRRLEEMAEKAAQDIERLQAENDRLRAALKRANDLLSPFGIRVRP